MNENRQTFYLRPEVAMGEIKLTSLAKEFYNGQTLKIEPQKRYKINFDEVNTLEDMKLILEAITIGFNVNFVENYNKFNELKKLLIEVE